MKLFTKMTTAAAIVTLSLSHLACSDDDPAGGGTGGSSGDGDGSGTGGMTGDGDGDGTGGMTGDGDGDGTGGMTGDGDGDGTGGMGGDCMTIVEAALATPELSSLVAAVEAAGLGEALEGDDLTVFAPTNDAFADLLEALDVELTDLTSEQLIPILTYHVADSVVPSSAAIEVAGMEDNTFGTLGGTITLAIEGDELVIDAAEAAATVVIPDVEACNGIVHVIDAVILPSITDIVVSQEGFSGLETLIGMSDTTTVDVAAALDGPSIAEDSDVWTLFAPDNDGVQALVDLDLGLSAEQVTTALLYHAYADGAVDAATAVTLDMDIAMASGEMLGVAGDAEAGTVTLMDGTDADGMVTVVDIHASNGIIHVIDKVLVPPTIAETL